MKTVDVVVRLTIEEDADTEEVVNEMIYVFEHEGLNDYIILDEEA